MWDLIVSVPDKKTNKNKNTKKKKKKTKKKKKKKKNHVLRYKQNKVRALKTTSVQLSQLSLEIIYY